MSAGTTGQLWFLGYFVNLPKVVQAVLKVFFSPAIYMTYIFFGALTTTSIIGFYTNFLTTTDFNYKLTVPNPVAGSGLFFAVPLATAWLAYTVYRWRRKHGAEA